MTSPRLASLLRFDQQSRPPSRLCQAKASLRRSRAGLLAGVDEAGRGPLAGPVVAAAVIFRGAVPFLEGLNDSKQVPPARREVLFRLILRHALAAVGTADEKEIDEINIHQASRLAMKRAVLALTRTPDLVLVDGRIRLDLPIAQRAVVGGDGKSAAIAAASIVAKVCRDGIMKRLDVLYPAYEFAKHKGYPTPAHLAALKTFGPSPVHRRSFAPVREEDLKIPGGGGTNR